MIDQEHFRKYPTSDLRWFLLMTMKPWWPHKFKCLWRCPPHHDKVTSGKVKTLLRRELDAR